MPLLICLLVILATAAYADPGDGVPFFIGVLFYLGPEGVVGVLALGLAAAVLLILLLRPRSKQPKE